MNNYGYIYKTTNLINGRVYIGQHTGTFNHKYLGSGKLIGQSITKYGRKNFRLEVLAFATTKDMLDGLEMKYIYEYRQVFGERFLYNITDGGKGSPGVKTEEHLKKIGKGNKGKIVTQETRNKIRISKFGSKLSIEVRLKLSKANIGKKLSQETKDKMRKSHLERYKNGDIPGMLGKKVTEETKIKISMSLLGKHHSEETKRKISNANSGRVHSEESRKNMSLSHLGKHYNTKNTGA